MKARLERWALRFDALSLRERAAVFAAVAVLLVFLANTLVIQRQRTSSHQLTELIDSEKSQLSAYEVQVKALEQAKTMDLDAANRDRLQRAQQQLSQLDTELAAEQNGLVGADQMPILLQDVLRRQSGLHLVELRALPVMPLIPRPAKDDKAAKPAVETAAPAAADANSAARNIYKHGFELTVRGSYPDFVQYLAQLERLPMRMYWSKVALNADDYPDVTLTVTVYTLSLDKAWLTV
jgi:MSHA biogenesis protein MshJ